MPRHGSNAGGEPAGGRKRKHPLDSDHGVKGGLASAAVRFPMHGNSAAQDIDYETGQLWQGGGAENEHAAAGAGAEQPPRQLTPALPAGALDNIGGGGAANVDMAANNEPAGSAAGSNGAGAEQPPLHAGSLLPAAGALEHGGGAANVQGAAGAVYMEPNNQMAGGAGAAPVQPPFQSNNPLPGADAMEHGGDAADQVASGPALEVAVRIAQPLLLYDDPLPDDESPRVNDDSDEETEEVASVGAANAAVPVHASMNAAASSAQMDPDFAYDANFRLHDALAKAPMPTARQLLDNTWTPYSSWTTMIFCELKRQYMSREFYSILRMVLRDQRFDANELHDWHTLNRYDLKSPSLAILMVKIANEDGIEVETPIMSPLAVFRAALSDPEVYDNLQVPYYAGRIGEPATSRNMHTHPCFGPVQWDFPNVQQRIRLGDIVNLRIDDAVRLAVLDGRYWKNGELFFNVCLIDEATASVHEARDCVQDSVIDKDIFARIGDVPATRELILHDALIRDVSPSQVISLYDSSESRIFRIDARTVANWDVEMAGFDSTRDRIMRWSLFRGKVYPLRTRTTHNCRRYPHLCDFVAPQNIPIKYLALESFVDAAQFMRYKSVLHHLLRILNLPCHLREKLERSQTLYFADSNIDAAQIMAALVPLWKQLEEGLVIHLDFLRSGQNPEGAVMIKSCFFSMASDMPQANFDSWCKGVGANIPCRHVTIPKDLIPTATFDQCVLYARVDEAHRSERDEVRQMTATAAAVAETERGILASTNTVFADNCAVNAPHQYLQRQCCLHMAKGQARDSDDLISRSITGVAQLELAHLCSAMTLHPADSRFPSWERMAEWGFQQLNYFFLYFPVILRIFLTPEKFRPTAKEYLVELHGNMHTAISCILSAFDSFAVLIAIMGRKSFDAQTGPSEVDSAVFGYRAAMVKAWGECHWRMPNFLNLTSLGIGLEFYGAMLFVQTTRLGERAHLRDKGISTNCRNYLLDLYLASARLAAKVALSVDTDGPYSKRFGHSVIVSLKHDPVYRHILGLAGAPVSNAAASAPEVCKTARLAAVELVDGQLRIDLASIASVFAMQSVIEILTSAAPLRIDEITSVSNARLPRGAILKVGHNVAFRWAPVSVIEVLPSSGGADRPMLARVDGIFRVANTIWLRATPYEYVPPAVADDAAASPLDAVSGNWCEVELQVRQRCVVPLCAIERHALLEHKHCLPSGAGVAFNPAIHCQFTTVRWAADTNPRRMIQCVPTNLRYLYNHAVSEKNAVFKSE